MPGQNHLSLGAWHSVEQPAVAGEGGEATRYQQSPPPPPPLPRGARRQRSPAPLRTL